MNRTFTKKIFFKPMALIKKEIGVNSKALTGDMEKHFHLSYLKIKFPRI